MEKTYKKEIHDGYKIGKDILIHDHINDRDSWFLTCRPLRVYGEQLCSKSCSEAEIARYTNLFLIHEKSKIQYLIGLVERFT